MRHDELWPGGPMFIHDNNAFRLGTDSVLLSAFASKGRAKRACDLAAERALSRYFSPGTTLQS